MYGEIFLFALFGASLNIDNNNNNKNATSSLLLQPICLISKRFPAGMCELSYSAI